MEFLFNLESGLVKTMVVGIMVAEQAVIYQNMGASSQIIAVHYVRPGDCMEKGQTGTRSDFCMMSRKHEMSTIT